MFRAGTRVRAFQTPLDTIKCRGQHQVQFRAYRQVRFGGQRPQYKRFQGAQNFLFRWAAKPTFYRDVGIITTGTAGVFVWNLEEVPISGRRRFNIVSAELEASLGKSSVDEVKQQYQGRFLPEYDSRVIRVKKVLDRLIPFAEAAGLHDTNWEVNVIDSPEQNAFVVPGGKVFVFTGLLHLCQNEDSIAAVLGHEIAHVVAHHTAERVSQSPLIFLGMVMLWAVDVSFMTSNLLLQLFLSWPASRKQEAEADYIGLMMMAEGCYRPEAAMEFWRKMEQLGQRGPPQILSTHPSHHNREEKIREWLPKAYEKAELSDCHATRTYADQFAAAFGGSSRW